MKLIEPLTPREIEVLCLLAKGLTNKEVAGKLVISERTVENHRTNLKGKTGLSRRWQFIELATDYCNDPESPMLKEPNSIMKGPSITRKDIISGTIIIVLILITLCFAIYAANYTPHTDETGFFIEQNSDIPSDVKPILEQSDYTMQILVGGVVYLCDGSYINYDVATQELVIRQCVK